MRVNRSDLEYLYVCAVCQHRSVFGAIEHGLKSLNETLDVEGKPMEIRLNMNPSKMSDIAGFVCNVVNIVKVFVMSPIQEWLFIVDFDNNEAHVGRIVNGLQNSADLFTITEFMKCSKRRLIIANKQCRMPPHDMWWLNEIAE